MSNNPVTNAFFFGRALAEVMSEKLEESFTNAMSDLGKFDAEQRENLRQFMEEVQSRAERASGTTVYPGSTNNSSSGTSSYVGFNIDTSSTNSEDLQTMLDQLRAEIATLRTELKKYR
jgi:methyl-accepting chemotaxis protein